MIADLQGVGLLVSMEIVADKSARTNFPPEREVYSILDRHCREEGVIPRLSNDRVAFAPPLIITEDEALEAVRRFRRALDSTWADLVG